VASAWGYSWGTSWGSSWGAVAAANEGGWKFRRVPRFHIDGDEGRRYFDTEAEAIAALRELRAEEKPKPKRLRKTYRLVRSERPAVQVTPPTVAAPKINKPAAVNYDDEDEELLLLFA